MRFLLDECAGPVRGIPYVGIQCHEQAHEYDGCKQADDSEPVLQVGIILGYNGLYRFLQISALVITWSNDAYFWQIWIS